MHTHVCVCVRVVSFLIFVILLLLLFTIYLLKLLISLLAKKRRRREAGVEIGIWGAGPIVIIVDATALLLYLRLSLFSAPHFAPLFDFPLFVITAFGQGKFNQRFVFNRFLLQFPAFLSFSWLFP